MRSDQRQGDPNTHLTWQPPSAASTFADTHWQRLLSQAGNSPGTKTAFGNLIEATQFASRLVQSENMALP